MTRTAGQAAAGRAADGLATAGSRAAARSAGTRPAGTRAAAAQALRPAVPSTPAQHGRCDRILQAATAMLSAGGEDALQMKELSQRADVSVATLYRYFPAKDHVLLAITLRRYADALRRVSAELPRGETVRERVTSQLLREFRAAQREQQLTTALSRVLTETSRTYSEMIERIEHVHLAVLEHVAGAGGPVTEHQRQVLPIVKDSFAAATRRWLAGVSSPAQARFEIIVGCRLLDLPDAVVQEDLNRAAPPVPPVPPGPADAA
ncbi:MAG: TetR/AcrR family transcriptional regulator [Streptosporangiaceae bacterium]